MASVTRTATIAESGNLSNAVTIDESMLLGLILPAAWDTADLTLQASHDGTNFANLYDSAGTEVTIKAAASRYVTLSPADFAGMQAIKLRSGTSGSPVTQTAARSITVVILAE